MSQSPANHEPRGVSGKIVLLVSLIACVAIPFVAFFIPVLVIESAKQPPAALDWSQRQSWEVVPVRPRVLHWGDTPRPPFEGRAVEELPFELEEAEVEAVRKLVQSARRFSDTPQGLGALDDITADRKTFYGDYLRGRLHARQGQTADAVRDLSAAYGAAPRVLVWRFVDDAGRPLVETQVGSIELVMIRMHDGKRDETLRLWYPNVTTDGQGRVWLPVYDTVYALGDNGWRADVTVEHELTRWFESPGKVGAMPDAVVTEARSR